MATEEFNDGLHNIIVDRLKERNRKLEIIKGYEKPKSKRVYSIVSFLAVACMVGIVVIVSIKTIKEPIDEPIRSGCENVQSLIDSGKYEEALIVVETELSSADSALNDLKNKENPTDEEIVYEIKAQQLKIQNLTLERDNLKKKLK